MLGDLEALGHDVWLDEQLSGGQLWWDEILGHIRTCDAFLFLVSPASVASEACLAELGYAQDLGRTVIPIELESMNPALLPSALGQHQLVSYSEGSRAELMALSRALGRLADGPAIARPAAGAAAVAGRVLQHAPGRDRGHRRADHGTAARRPPPPAGASRRRFERGDPHPAGDVPPARRPVRVGRRGGRRAARRGDGGGGVGPGGAGAGARPATRAARRPARLADPGAGRGLGPRRPAGDARPGCTRPGPTPSCRGRTTAGSCCCSSSCSPS